MAISSDRIIAASADFQQVKQLVRAKGLNPRNVLIIEAGSDEPDYVHILSLTVNQ